jgi:butyryl-CoA dehydrogenase
MGCRNVSSTVLSFGEQQGAVAYLVGAEGQGLACMFKMMNEARIGVGLMAAATALRGYAKSLAYARERPQGRLPSDKDPSSPQVMLVRHADVRRMLIAQKAYAEGALALCLYATSLFEDERTHPDPARRRRAALLLALLTPVVKSWSARYGCVSNDLAIQVLGGAGYTREYPVEALYRDQRLNPIHEGTEGIHGVALLGREVRLDGGVALSYLREELEATAHAAQALPDLAALGESLRTHAALLFATTEDLVAAATTDVDRALANSTLYLDVFGRVVAAWIWLLQGVVAARGLAASTCSAADEAFYRGKIQAARYYYAWELPQIEPATRLLRAFDAIPLETKDEWL